MLAQHDGGSDMQRIEGAYRVVGHGGTRSGEYHIREGMDVPGGFRGIQQLERRELLEPSQPLHLAGPGNCPGTLHDSQRRGADAIGLCE